MKKHVPEKEWQTGEFGRVAEFRITIPHQLLMLCRLMNVTPQQLIVDFMDNLSCGSWKRYGRDEAKKHLIKYFIAHNYGNELYSEEEIRTIFKEMNAIGLLYPVNGPDDIIKEHTRWRENYHTWWFKKWFEKYNRAI